MSIVPKSIPAYEQELRWTEADASARREHAIAAIASNANRGLIGEVTAIRQMRDKGLTEPEIWELIG